MANKSSKAKQQIGVGIAVCSLTLNAAGELQLTPAGSFRGIDGLPKDVPAWFIDAKAAENVIAFNSSRSVDLVIDYEHQTLHKEKNGQPAPAAGWFNGADLVWRDGEGLFARANLTQRAKEFISAGEYKYLSPVFFYDKKTGAVRGIHSAALTNTPNIDGMAEIALAAANQALDGASIEITQENLVMDIEELLEQLRWLLNLPTLATKEEIIAELNKAVGLIKQSNPTETAAASFNIGALVTSLNAQVAALSAATPDLAKFAPVEAMQALQTELSTLRAANLQREVDGVVVAALSQGKLLPAQEKWARELGTSNLAALNQYLDTAQPISALTGTQTDGKGPDDNGGQKLSEAELAMCSQMGIDSEAFLKTKLGGAQA